jgi:hypothetical protein
LCDGLVTIVQDIAAKAKNSVKKDVFGWGNEINAIFKGFFDLNSV